LFDPNQSRNGAMISASKAVWVQDGLAELLASRAPTGSAGVRGEIIAPNALFMGGNKKRKRDKEEQDAANPSKTMCPEPPATGFKTGSQSSVTVTFTQFVANSSINQNKQIAGKDPREELFKYTEGKSYLGGDDGEEQRVLAEKTVEQEEEEAISKQGKS